jgi:uncharacterized protein YcbX
MSVEVLYGLDSTYDKPDQKVSNETLSVPLSPRTEDLEVLDITMHKSPTKAYDMGASYNEWFSKRLGFEVKLLYIGKNRRKVLGNLPPKTKSARVGIVALITACTSCLLAMLLYTNRTSTPRVLGLVTLSILFLAIFVLYRPVGILPTTKSTIGRKGHNITFADLAPYLVISTKSVQNIQGRLPEDAVLDLTKFRPNIVIDGATEAFEEDFWAELLIGDNTTITLTQNCARCNSLNVDYKTGKTASDATGKILKLLSKDRRVDSGTKWSPVFGRYGFLTASDRNQDTVSLREGDAVRVSARNQQRTTLGKLLTANITATTSTDDDQTIQSRRRIVLVVSRA